MSELCGGPKAGSELKAKRVEQDVGETRRTDKSDKSDRAESKNKCSATGSKDSASTLGWKVITTRIPYDSLMVSSLTLFDVNDCIGSILTD